MLLKCDWMDTIVDRGIKMDKFGYTLTNFVRLIHIGELITDNSFVSYAQVYYVVDERDLLTWWFAGPTLQTALQYRQHQHQPTIFR
jgi:hypothetical protein